jgi:hypothetical protein
MIFETLNASAEKGELMLVGGGMCHWHLRRDGQLTIREIISMRRGAGSQILERLRLTPGATSLFAKCPAGLKANEWYSKRGFHVERMEVTRTGRKLLHWRLNLVEQKRRPNVGGMELIYCANGNPRYAQIAIDAGWRYGAQIPGSVGYRPYFIDQDWKNPDREKYMAALAEHRPHLATVLDWERLKQLDEVISWAEEAAQYVSYVVIIPKVPGEVGRIPEKVAGKPTRLGYSVPTKYAGTPCQLWEFGDRPVHLLGGNPKKQFELAQVLNVWSADMNYHRMVSDYGRYYTASDIGKIKNWPQLEEVDGYILDGPYEAFKRSCRNIKAQYEQILALPKKAAPAPQLAMWTAAELV